MKKKIKESLFNLPDIQLLEHLQSCESSQGEFPKDCLDSILELHTTRRKRGYFMNFEDIETRLHEDASYCRSNDFILDCIDFVCQHTGLPKSKAEKIVQLLDSRATSAMDLLLAVGEFVNIFEE